MSEYEAFEMRVNLANGVVDFMRDHPDNTVQEILEAGVNALNGSALDGVINHCPDCGCSELLCGYNGNEENCSTYKYPDKEDEDDDINRCDKCSTLYGHCSCD